MRLTAINFEGKRSGTVKLNPGLWKRMAEIDKQRVLQFISDGALSSYRPTDRREGRNFIYTLAAPIETARVTVKALRFKGASPRFAKNGRVLLHRGAGYVKNPLQFDLQNSE